MSDTIKEKFALACVQQVQKLADVMDAAPDLRAEYNVYSAFTDADLERLGITAAELTSIMTLFEQVDKFCHNEAVTQGDYSVTINKARRAG